MHVNRLVLYAIGSSLSVDVEETASRAGLIIAAGVSNRSGPHFLSAGTPITTCAGVDDELKDLDYLVPLFTPRHRASAQREAAACGFTRPGRLIDPAVTLPRRCDIDQGCYVNIGCAIGSHSAFGPFCLLNRAVNIGHHARFGAFVSVGPGATIAGHVMVDTGVAIGAGAVIVPKVSIGAHAVVGAGSVVLRDVPPHCLAVGNPARIVRADLPGFDQGPG